MLRPSRGSGSRRRGCREDSRPAWKGTLAALGVAWLWCAATAWAGPDGLISMSLTETAPSPERGPASLSLAMTRASAQPPDGPADRPADQPVSAGADRSSGPGDSLRQGPRRFGEKGSTWLTFGGAYADNRDDAVDYNLHVGYTTFLADDVEFTWETGGWFYDQAGDNAVGASTSAVFRYHFVSRPTWSIYADAGIGVMLATDNVPDGGTSFDLMPRLGVGATYQILNNGTRVQAGLRWHHISNARLNGEVRNPSRDSAALYLGVVVPF